RLCQHLVALRQLLAQAVGKRREAHRLPDRLRGVVRGTGERRRDRPADPCRLDEFTERARIDRKPVRHGDSGREQLSEIRALAAERRLVGSAQLGKRPGERGRHASRIVTTPFDPSTRIVCPVRMDAVARPVPTTAGSPYSRQTIAACDITPPMSVTTALIFGKIGAQAGEVIGQTGTSPSRTFAISSTSMTICAGPSTTPGDAA